MARKLKRAGKSKNKTGFVYRPHDIGQFNQGPLFPRAYKGPPGLISGPTVYARWPRQHTAGIVGIRDQTFYT